MNFGQGVKCQRVVTDLDHMRVEKALDHFGGLTLCKFDIYLHMMDFELKGGCSAGNLLSNWSVV